MKYRIGMVAAFLVALTLASTVYAADWVGVIMSLCSTTVGCPSTPTPAATPTPVVNNTGVWRALDFLNSIGADTKIIQGDNTAQMIINASNYTGIKHFRDTASVFLVPNMFGGNYGSMCQIAQATGGQFIVLPAAFGFENTPTSQNNIQITQSTLEYLASCGALDTEFIGGQNELNNSDTPWFAADCPGGGSYWACEQYTAALYQMVHNANPNAMCTGPAATIETDKYGGAVACCTGAGIGHCPVISNRLVIGPSEVGAENDNVGLQFLTIPAANATGSGNETTNIPLNCCAANGHSGSGNILPGTKLADVADYHNYIGTNAGNILDNQSRYAVSLTRSGPDAGSWDYWGETLGGTATNRGGNLPICAHGDPTKSGCDSGTWGANYPIGNLVPSSIKRVSTETGSSLFGGAIITPQTQANLDMVNFLDQYQTGFLRTWVYLLINDQFDGGFGFFNGACTPAGNQIGAPGTTCTDEMDAGNATPLGNYMHNFTTILADTSANFTPTVPSGLSVSGLTVPSPLNNDSVNQPTMYYNQLIQKSNGTYELVLWGESFISQRSTTGTVNLGATFKTVNTYDITLGSGAQTTRSNVSSVPVTLLDHIVIVEFHN